MHVSLRPPPHVVAGAALAIVATFALIGCGAAAAPSATPDAPQPVGPSAPASTGASAPAGSDEPSAPAGSDEPAAALPPSAVLQGGDRSVPGELGSYVFEGSGSDSPWLPFDSLSVVTVAAGVPLTIAFEDGTTIATWSAAVAAAEDEAGEAGQGVGGRGSGEPPLAAVATDAIPVGRWVLSVRLELADGRGDATYYWALEAG